MPKNTGGDHEYYIEYFSAGNSVKVTAIDPATGIEASIVGAPQLSQDALAKLAIRKLKYVMAKGKQILPPEDDDI